MQRRNALYYNGPMDPAATGVPSHDTDTGNPRVVDRANLLPFGLYDDGSVTLAWPQIVQGPRDAKARIEGAMSSGHFTRSTVAGIRRDFKIPANMTDPASAFWLATPND